MLVTVNSAAVLGTEAYKINIEIDESKRLPGQSIVGLPDAAVKESRDRVRAAIENSGFYFPPGYFTINLAPADTKKEGPLYDLPIALGILLVSEQIMAENLDDTIILGELSLDGSVRPISGVLAICMSLAKSIKRIIVPKANADEAAMVEGVEVIAAESLKQIADYLSGAIQIKGHKIDISKVLMDMLDYELDFCDVKGQGHVKRALEISAAGGHNLLMVGPPGCGKTMLARRLPSIMPPLSIPEALEVTKLYSIAGHFKHKSALIKSRPFRSPHHTTSDVAIIGGTRIPKPGEVSLAHLGVLFLDELPEFDRKVLEGLRQPLEDGCVTVSRAQATFTYPAQFMLIASMNPCPCGRLYDQKNTCVCSVFDIQRYWKKLSGPLLDRIDIHLEVAKLNTDELSSMPQGESSAVIRERVLKARDVQLKRFVGSKTFVNAVMTAKQVKENCVMDSAAQTILKSAVVHFALSGRAYDKVLRLSRTIADLEGAQTITSQHIAEALQYRTFDKKEVKLGV